MANQSSEPVDRRFERRRIDTAGWRNGDARIDDCGHTPGKRPFKRLEAARADALGHRRGLELTRRGREAIDDVVHVSGPHASQDAAADVRHPLVRRYPDSIEPLAHFGPGDQIALIPECRRRFVLGMLVHPHVFDIRARRARQSLGETTFEVGPLAVYHRPDGDVDPEEVDVADREGVLIPEGRQPAARRSRNTHFQGGGRNHSAAPLRQILLQSRRTADRVNACRPVERRPR
jgi:hypothetical protein